MNDSQNHEYETVMGPDGCVWWRDGNRWHCRRDGRIMSTLEGLTMNNMVDLIKVTIQNRTDQIAREMNRHLYGDYGPPPTRWQRIKWLPARYWRRISDAWLVLRGKANVE
jgi:hypothetical protein